MAARRGPKRSETARIAILEAAAAELSDHGYDGLRIEAIASRAAVGKQTVYRWWPSKAAILADCVIEGLIPSLAYAPDDTGDIEADLTRWVGEAIALIDDEEKRGLMRGLMAAALDSATVAESDAANGPMADLIARLTSARDAGQLPADADIETIATAMIGVLTLRILEPRRSKPASARRIVAALVPKRS